MCAGKRSARPFLPLCCARNKNALHQMQLRMHGGRPVAMSEKNHCKTCAHVRPFVAERLHTEDTLLFAVASSPVRTAPAANNV